MKMDALQLLGADGKLGGTKKGAKIAPGFESALKTPVAQWKERALGHDPARADSSKAEKDEKSDKPDKKPRVITTAEELLLMARSLTPHVRPDPLIVTKPVLHKVEAAKVGAEQLAARAKGLQEHTRVAGPTEPKKPLPVVETQGPVKDPKKAEEPALGMATPLAAPTNEPFRIEAPVAIQAAAPLAQVAPLMLEDASVRAVLLPTVARMTLDTGEAGQLNVQLKVRDGVTEIRAGGPAAQLLESRQGELRVALAKEGLALGHFDLTQSGSQQRHERPEFDGAAPTARRAAASTQDSSVEDGRGHVKV